MKQKLLITLLSLGLCIGCPASVLAQDMVTDQITAFSDENKEEDSSQSETNVLQNGITYQYQKETDSYVVLHGSGQRNVELADNIQGKKVTAIAPKAFYQDKNVENVSYGKTPFYLEAVGESAFEGCTNLKNVDIPSIRYEKNSFYGCENLIDVYMGDRSYVASHAFWNCPKLQSLSVEVLEGDSDAFDMDNKIIVLNETVSPKFSRFHIRYIGAIDYDFGDIVHDNMNNIQYFDGYVANCKEEASGRISLLASAPHAGAIRTIGRKAFYKCQNVKEVIIPNGVSTIEREAFYGCQGLTRVQIPSSVIKIEDHAFDECSNLVIYAPEGSYGAGYASREGIPCVTKDSEILLTRPAAPTATVSGNKVTAVLPVKTNGAEGYEFIIGKANCYKTGKPLQKQICGRSGKVTFQYIKKGVFSIYVRAYRTVGNEKVYSDWSLAGEAEVKAVTPYKPSITKVTVSGSTVTVWLSEAKNADRYDVILSKGRDGAKPLKYAYSKKNKTGRKFVFKNVKKGTYYVAARSSNTTGQNGSRIYSKWAGMKKAVVK